MGLFDRIKKSLFGQKDEEKPEEVKADQEEAAEENGGFMDVEPYFALKTAQKTIQMGWVPSIGDLSANDWVILL
mgnify:CR=1 FL=1